MAKYIDADKLLKDMEFVTNDTTCPLHIAATIDQTISLAETADVVEVKHAKWEINPDGYYPYCGNCKTEPKNGLMSKYCPHCGAKMDGKKE